VESALVRASSLAEYNDESLIEKRKRGFSPC